MSKILDLKSLGVIQDVKELKSKKEKSSSNFDVGYAKERLKLNKERIRVRDSPEYSREQKAAAYETISRRENKEKEKAGIRKQEQSIYENSFEGKANKNILAGAKKLAAQRIISRSILKKGQMQVNIPERKVESIWNDPNRFFKGELNKEKGSLYFS